MKDFLPGGVIMKNSEQLMFWSCTRGIQDELLQLLCHQSLRSSSVIRRITSAYKWEGGSRWPTVLSISSTKFDGEMVESGKKRADIMQILAAALPHKKAKLRPWRMITQFSLKKYLRYCGTVQRAASTKVTQMLSLTMTRWRRLLLPRLWSDIYWQPHR